MSMQGIETLRVCGAEAEPYLGDLARLRIEVFREYPYLYDGTLSYEQAYLSRYAATSESVFVIARDGSEVVGAATALPLADAEADFQKPFRERGYDLDTIFYFGESVLRKDYRGRGLGSRFMRDREAFARSRDRFRWCVFCAVERAEDDPRRPAGYVPLHAFWRRRGFAPDLSLRARFAWKEIGEAAESAKAMRFWTKRLG